MIAAERPLQEESENEAFVYGYRDSAGNAL